MKQSDLDKVCFERGRVQFSVHAKPVSLQNDGEKRSAFKKELQRTTSQSEYIITGTCWVAIDYYCQHVRRLKNPGVYDIDNIIKPILDGLVGENGLLVDDVVVDRVIVNWIDTPDDDWFEVQIDYPDLLFTTKVDLIFLKSRSGWCFPSSARLASDPRYLEQLRKYFSTWESIETEDDYYRVACQLPIQGFIYYGKIKDKGFRFVEFANG